MGLGLLLAQNIVIELSEGKGISFASEYELGSNFNFLIKNKLNSPLIYLPKTNQTDKLQRREIYSINPLI